MKPRKFSYKRMYQTELKQKNKKKKCILKILMLAGEKNKREEKEGSSPNSGA